MRINIKTDKISPLFWTFYPFKEIKISIQNIYTNSPLLKLFLTLTTSLIDYFKNWYHKEKIDADHYLGKRVPCVIKKNIQMTRPWSKNPALEHIFQML